MTTTTRRRLPRYRGEPTPRPHARCRACGGPLDAGWTVPTMHNRVCLICETARTMADWTWPPQRTKEARHG